MVKEEAVCKAQEELWWMWRTRPRRRANAGFERKPRAGPRRRTNKNRTRRKSYVKPKRLKIAKTRSISSATRWRRQSAWAKKWRRLATWRSSDVIFNVGEVTSGAVI